MPTNIPADENSFLFSQQDRKLGGYWRKLMVMEVSDDRATGRFLLNKYRQIRQKLDVQSAMESPPPAQSGELSSNIEEEQEELDEMQLRLAALESTLERTKDRKTVGRKDEESLQSIEAENEIEEGELIDTDIEEVTGNFCDAGKLNEENVSMDSKSSVRSWRANDTDEKSSDRIRRKKSSSRRRKRSLSRSKRKRRRRQSPDEEKRSDSRQKKFIEWQKAQRDKILRINDPDAQMKEYIRTLATNSYDIIENKEQDTTFSTEVSSQDNFDVLNMDIDEDEPIPPGVTPLKNNSEEVTDEEENLLRKSLLAQLQNKRSIEETTKMPKVRILSAKSLHNRPNLIKTFANVDSCERKVTGDADGLLTVTALPKNKLTEIVRHVPGESDEIGEESVANVLNEVLRSTRKKTDLVKAQKAPILSDLQKRLTECERDVNGHRNRVETDRLKLSELETIQESNRMQLRTAKLKRRQLILELRHLNESIPELEANFCRTETDTTKMRQLLAKNEATLNDFEVQWKEIQRIIEKRHDEEKQPLETEKLPDLSRNPLFAFPEYRLSPEFPPELLTSVTYSNRFDPNWPLCPFDLCGRCADWECQWQHERDYRLTEEEIILDLIQFDYRRRRIYFPFF